MRAVDVMATRVITVRPDALAQDVAYVLLSNRISAVPVVGEDGRLVGIVSEGDLMRRTESGTGRQRAWWLAMLTGSEALAGEFVKENSRRITDVMTRSVVTGTPDMPLHAIATLLESNGIKRLPIVQDGAVVGIVSRANLLCALASASSNADIDADDNAIRASVLARLDAEPWAHQFPITVIVQDGTAELWGMVDSQAEKKAVRVAAEVTPGVRAVKDNLFVRPAVSGL